MKFLQKAAQAAFAVLSMRKDISLVLINDAKMKALNKKYRGENETTDVLSFEDLNEIFISVPQAKRQAKFNPPAPLCVRGGKKEEFCVRGSGRIYPPCKGGRGGLKKIRHKRRLSPINCELTRLLAHGIVHLAGYDHIKSAKEAARMFAVEEKILKKILCK